MAPHHLMLKGSEGLGRYYRKHADKLMSSLLLILLLTSLHPTHHTRQASSCYLSVPLPKHSITSYLVWISPTCQIISANTQTDLSLGVSFGYYFIIISGLLVDSCYEIVCLWLHLAVSLFGLVFMDTGFTLYGGFLHY